MTDSSAILAFFALAAAAYAFVGHGGGSAYLAILGALGCARPEMRATALTLNLVVSGLAFVAFARSRRVRPDVLGLTAAGGVPAAFLGARLGAPAPLFWALIATALLFTAARLFFPKLSGATRLPEAFAAPARSRPALLAAGAALGLLAGMCGIGGGVFLGPWILLIVACEAHESAGICAGYIFLNSLAGLAGTPLPETWSFPTTLAAVVAMAGAAGAHLGSRYAAPAALRRGLALVLALAAAKCVQHAF